MVRAKKGRVGRVGGGEEEAFLPAFRVWDSPPHSLSAYTVYVGTQGLPLPFPFSPDATTTTDMFDSPLPSFTSPLAPPPAFLSSFHVNVEDCGKERRGEGEEEEEQGPSVLPSSMKHKRRNSWTTVLSRRKPLFLVLFYLFLPSVSDGAFTVAYLHELLAGRFFSQGTETTAYSFSSSSALFRNPPPAPAPTPTSACQPFFNEINWRTDHFDQRALSTFLIPSIQFLFFTFVASLLSCLFLSPSSLEGLRIWQGAARRGSGVWKNRFAGSPRSKKRK